MWIEHRPVEDSWKPVSAGEQVGKVGLSSFRYNVDILGKSSATYDVLEKETAVTKWVKDADLKQFKNLLAVADLEPQIRERILVRVQKREVYDALRTSETRLNQLKETAGGEQRRIKDLMSSLNREDELHARYLKKLATLESEIESASNNLASVRKEMDGLMNPLDLGKLSITNPVQQKCRSNFV